MKRKKLMLTELWVVAFILVLGFVYMFPSFIGSQSINTPMHIPDHEFRVFLEKHLGVEPGERYTKKQAAELKKLKIHTDLIENIKGIEYFTGLEEINVDLNNSNINMESLDLSLFNHLKQVSISCNNLEHLDVSKNQNLEILYIDYSPITTLDLSNNPHIKSLSICGTSISNLDIKHLTQLEELYFHNTLLSELDVSQNSKLTSLRFVNSKLTNIDLSHNPNLTMTEGDSNPLEEIDLSHNPKLEKLFLSFCKLKSVMLAEQNKIEYLFLTDNNLPSIPDHINVETVEHLDLSNNFIGCDEIPKIIEINDRAKSINFSIQFQRNMNLKQCADGNKAFRYERLQ